MLSVTSQLLPNETARELKEKQKERELNSTLSSENNSGETDTYEDSSSNSLPDSIEGDGRSYVDGKGEYKSLLYVDPFYLSNYMQCHSNISSDARNFLGTKTFPFGLQKTSTSIDEEDEVAIKLMHEEDLSFQLLQDADTVHKYVFKKIK